MMKSVLAVSLPLFALALVRPIPGAAPPRPASPAARLAGWGATARMTAADEPGHGRTLAALLESTRDGRRTDKPSIVPRACRLPAAAPDCRRRAPLP